MASDQFDARTRTRIKYLLSNGRDQKVTFATLLDFASLLGVGVVDILERPQESASPLLVEAESALRLGVSLDAGGVEKLTSILTDGDWFCNMGYVPSISCVLRATRLRRSHLEQVPPSVVSAYDYLDSHCLHPRYMDMELSVQKSIKVSIGCLLDQRSQPDYLSQVRQSMRFLRSAREEDVHLVAAVCIRIALHWLFTRRNTLIESAYREALQRLLPSAERR